MKYGQTDPSAAEYPSEGCGQSGENRLCSVQVSVFGTHLVLFSISPKLPKYLSWTLAQVHAHYWVTASRIVSMNGTVTTPARLPLAQ
ncbi:hypothetical protein HETIRDRAFT_310015 [Heterobasidion irregulare TC 32-1]|uniref:Uncharacterized protein n=1 Tax=Heterobasidion irregulare (strain TC 32-1) TaxID=747525 RepID=W4KKK2_HETIT|nr:uncharacterized protein HETIRDRAFT_310015 [Heterobasidion irregulare TC 32-1]ETW85596.1 hypothetical protein HETIRDRAFT_310015 [Heterobasidion irregulare TC 32-1]